MVGYPNTIKFMRTGPMLFIGYHTDPEPDNTYRESQGIFSMAVSALCMSGLVFYTFGIYQIGSD
jgi:hypothetical protein